MSTFVSIGNAKQSFSRLLKAVCVCANKLPQPVIVQYGHTLFNCESTINVDFMKMSDFQQHLNVSKVVNFHAGGGSVSNAIRAGKIPIILPRDANLDEHIDNHQVEFSQELSRMNKAVVLNSDIDIIAAIDKVKKIKETNAFDRESEMTALIHGLLIKYSLKKG